MQVQRTLKRREGVWGIVKQRLAQSDKRIANARHLRFKDVIGGARKLAPLSPLTKLTTFRIVKRCFANAQHDKWNLWRCGFNRTYKIMSATKVAPPFLPFLLLWDSTPSLAEGARGWVIASEHNVRAWQPTGKESS